MSCDFYFRQWKLVLAKLQYLIQIDLEYQTEKAHDQQLSDAVQRIICILVKYMTIYNEAMECVHNNLQVQKTKYMEMIVKATALRILELKHDLEELENSPYHFFGTGLIINKQTYDPEVTVILKAERSKIVQEAIETAFLRVKEKEERAVENPEPEVLDEEKEEINEIDDIFMKLEEMRKTYGILLEEGKENENNESIKLKEDIKSEEESLRTDYVNLIKAHEKLRQITRFLQIQKLKREAWERELLGIAVAPARYEMRQKAAELINKIVRVYFSIKRKRIKESRLDQKLGLALCKHPRVEKLIKIAKKPENPTELYKKYQKECTSQRENIMEQYMNRKFDDVSDDFRDRIRHWFYEWFGSVQFIHKIPKGGSIAIFRDDVPDPQEWIVEYEELMNLKKSAKNQTPQQLKYEKEAEKKLEQKIKKNEIKVKNAEAALLMKMMKSPATHPGYFYKQSKRTSNLLKTINSYHTNWEHYDAQDKPEVKCKHIEELNAQDAYMNAKLAILEEVDENMEVEYKALKKALKQDYKRNNKVMPGDITEVRRRKRRRKVKAVRSDRIVDKLEILATQGFVTEYPETKLQDYIGDPNFSGDDRRRSFKPSSPHSYEIRSYWWDKCQRAAHGCQKILLVGPEQSGKVTLVHSLASMNDAVLFEIDPEKFPTEILNPGDLKQLTENVAFCAKAVQPSVIYIRHLQKLFYIKEPPQEAGLRLTLIKRLFMVKLFKKIEKHDKVTIIGTCSEPWLARSVEMVKMFPTVVLLPNVSYSLAVLLLNNWVGRYPSIPSTFNVSSLAYILQKYSYGFLTNSLKEFMSDERLIRIAVYGLTPMDVYDYMLQNEHKEKFEYERYLKWYFAKTPVGRKEKAHLDAQVEFMETVEEMRLKKEKKEKLARRSAPTSLASSRTAL